MVAPEPLPKAPPESFPPPIRLSIEPPSPTVEAPPLSTAKLEPESTADFGKSIGVLLGQAPHGENGEEEHRRPAVQEPEVAASGERLPIERALRLAKGEEEEPAEETPTEVTREPSLNGPKLMLAGLFVLALVFSAVAVAGVIMFVRKNGVPDISSLASRISLFKQPEPAAPSPETTRQETINLAVLVSQEPAAAGDLLNVVSRVVETDVKASKIFDATGSAPAPSAKSAGTLVIVNGTSGAYTFVATTRFLSKEGVLFRLNRATPIPAKGRVRAAVTADKPGPHGDIGPTTFTIPGLAENLRDDIYGESDAAISGGSGTAAAVSSEDLAKAKAALLAELEAEAGKNIEAMLLDGEKVVKELVTSEELAVEAPTEGVKAATFSLELSMRFRALVLPEPALRQALLERLKAGRPDAADADLGPARFRVQAYDVAGQRADVRVEADILGD